MVNSEISHYDIFCWPNGLPEEAGFLGTIENIGGTNRWIGEDHILQFVDTCTLNGCDFFPRALVTGLNWCAVSAVDVKGLTSEFSNPVNFIIPPWPNSPQIL